MITTPSGNYAGYTVTSDPLNLGVLELDLDPLSERVLVQTRGGKYITMRLKPVNHLLSVIVPLEYTTGNELIVTMFDDTGTDNAECVDRIQATQVDIKTYQAL